MISTSLLSWVPVPDFECSYLINRFGTIVSLYKKKQGIRMCCSKEYCYIATRKSGAGYYIVDLHKNGKRKTCHLHRLLALAFIPNPEGKPQVNHIDGNPLNNALENLEWVTPSQNVLHAYKTGLVKKIAQQRKVIHQATREIFPSIKAAARAFKLSYNSLKNQLNGHRKNYSGFLYYEDYQHRYPALETAA